jgi:hypothetical protein
MKHLELKNNMSDIATDVFRDTQGYEGSFCISIWQLRGWSSAPIQRFGYWHICATIDPERKRDLEIALALEIDKNLSRTREWCPHNKFPSSGCRRKDYYGGIVNLLLWQWSPDRLGNDHSQCIFCFLPFIHNYQRTYLKQIAVQSDTKDWKMVSIEKISRKFIQLDSTKLLMISFKKLHLLWPDNNLTAHCIPI